MAFTQARVNAVIRDIVAQKLEGEERAGSWMGGEIDRQVPERWPIRQLRPDETVVVDELDKSQRVLYQSIVDTQDTEDGVARTPGVAMSTCVIDRQRVRAGEGNVGVYI